MKKTLAIVILAVLCICTAVMAEDTYTVGVSQLVQHVALDAATQGFQDALTEKLGDAVKFDVQNASGDSNTCSTIVNTFISNGVDLIMANATPALQAAVAATGDIPILGTSVTDYATALDIDDWSGATGMNVSVPGSQKCRSALLLRRTELQVPDRRHQDLSGRIRLRMR